jgi:hypothetical protein
VRLETRVLLAQLTQAVVVVVVVLALEQEERADQESFIYQFLVTDQHHFPVVLLQHLQLLVVIRYIQ